MKRNTVRYVKPAILLLIASALILSVFFQYYTQVSRNLDQETRRNLIEQADQSTKVLQTKLDDSFAYLESLAGVISSYDDFSDPAVLSYLSQQDANSLFENFLVAGVSGQAVAGDGTRYFLGDSPTFQAALKGENAVSKPVLSVVSGERGVELSVPVFRGKEVVGTLQCDYRIELLRELYDGQMFGGAGKVNVIASDGTMITNTAALDEYGTYFEALEQVELLNGKTIDSFRQDLSGGRSGILEFNFMGKKRYVVYAPVDRNDWFVLTSVPANVVDAQAHKLALYAAVLVGEVMLIICLLVVYFSIVQHRNKKRIQKNEQQLSSLIANIPGGVCRYRTDQCLKITFASPGFCSLFGYGDGEAPSQLISLIHPDDLSAFKAQLKEQTAGSRRFVLEHRAVCQDGTVLWLLQRGQMLLEDGEQAMTSVLVDITEQKNTQHQLEISEQRYRAVIDQSDSVVFELDCKTGRAEFSDVWEKKFGYPPVQENFMEAVVRGQVIHPNDVHKYLVLFSKAGKGGSYCEEIIRLRKGSDRYIWCSVGLTSIAVADGVPTRLVGVVKDVDEEQRAVHKIQDEARRDALTGLYNKKFTQKMIEEYLAGTGINGMHAFLIIDIDHFKQVNDTLGHLLGDAVIAEVARRIQVPFRNSDIIGRFGGDEFVVFIKNIRTRAFVEKKAAEILRSFHTPAPGTDYPLSGSIGISLYSVDGLNYGELYRKADEGLYQAKRNGRDQACFYTEKQENSDSDSQ